jgi:hypothetical protein
VSSQISSGSTPAVPAGKARHSSCLAVRPAAALTPLSASHKLSGATFHPTRRGCLSPRRLTSSARGSATGLLQRWTPSSYDMASVAKIWVRCTTRPHKSAHLPSTRSRSIQAACLASSSARLNSSPLCAYSSTSVWWPSDASTTAAARRTSKVCKAS